MKFTRKMMLALAVVGAGVLTSCKDYEESDYTEVVVSLGQAEKDVATLKSRVDSLAKELAQGGSCHCQGVKIVRNSDGTFTIETKDGIKATFSPSTPAAPGDPSSVQQDANGQFIIAPDGTKIYVPTIINEGDKYYIYQNGQKVEIPTGNSSIITVGEDGSITINDGTHDPVVLGKVKSDVTVQKDGKGNPISLTITTYDNAGKEVGKTIVPVFSDAEKTAWNKAVTDLAALTLIVQGADGNGGLVGDMKDVQKNTSDIFKELYGEGGTPAAPKEGSAMARLSQLEDDFAELKAEVEKLQDALKKLVTGIIVEQVYSSALGSYNSLLTNVQTSALVTYYGKASKYVEFPSCAAELGVTPEIFFAGQTLVGDNEDNAGKLYLTINPIGENFNSLTGLELVNTQGVASAVTLGSVKQSDAVLTFGLTRASNSGLYEVPAYLSAEAIESAEAGKLHINFDKGLIKQAIKDAKAKNVNATIADLVKVAKNAMDAIRLEALGVKCAWTDATGDHVVKSASNIAAIAAQPLAFTVFDGFTNVPGYNQAVKAINKIKNKVDEKVIARINKEIAKYKEKIEQRGIIAVESKTAFGKEGFAITISYKGNADVETTIKQINDEYISEGLDPVIIESRPESKEIVVFYTVSEFNDFVDGIALNDLATFTDMVNDLIKQVDGKIEKIENKAYNKVMEYLDKFNTKGTKAMHKVAHPTLLVNSDKGFQMASVKGAVPAVVSGKVELYPTTYSGEIIAPVFKKFLVINGKGVSADGLKPVDVTSMLVKGVNTIKYYALDYKGNEESIEYQLELK